MLQPGIFNTPRPKRPLLPNPNKKRKTEHKVEEISFDNDARADYLTGFHKRKVERAKRAKAEKKMREERVVVRKQVCLPFLSWVAVESRQWMQSWAWEERAGLIFVLVARREETGVGRARQCCECYIEGGFQRGCGIGQ